MRARRRVEGTFDLDVTPILSLIVHLIPMILLAVRFTTLNELSARGPVLPTQEAPSQQAYARQSSKVVSVRITGAGFVVGGVTGIDPVIACKGDCGPTTYDYAQLGSALRTARQEHPDEQRVVVAPEGPVPFEVIALVMATARAYRNEGGAEVPLFAQPLLAAPPPPAAP